MVAGSDATTGGPVALPDPDGTAPGRGAHLHPVTECYELAVRRKAFARALRLAAGKGEGSPAHRWVTTSPRDSNSTDRPEKKLEQQLMSTR
ncbi:YlxR family protein [Nocardioides sp. TF02-7]|nr:YlxR family protein [Nocardioides sp. TF02-7]